MCVWAPGFSASQFSGFMKMREMTIQTHPAQRVMEKEGCLHTPWSTQRCYPGTRWSSPGTTICQTRKKPPLKRAQEKWNLLDDCEDSSWNLGTSTPQGPDSWNQDARNTGHALLWNTGHMVSPLLLSCPIPSSLWQDRLALLQRASQKRNGSSPAPDWHERWLQLFGCDSEFLGEADPPLVVSCGHGGQTACPKLDAVSAGTPCHQAS